MPDGPPFSCAAELAFRLHDAQQRKGTTIPYLSHLRAVSALVLEHGGDQEQAVAALLHDVVEDCGALQSGSGAAGGAPKTPQHVCRGV